MKFKHSDIEIPREDPFKNCKLNRQPNAIILTQIVQNYSDGFVLSINGEWGTGKTTFMKMWAAYLKQQEITSIYFNAWENDFISDPMIALLGELQQLKTSKTAKTLNSILDIGSKIAIKTIPTLTKGIVKHYCGNELAEAAKDALKAGAEIFKTEVIEYENKKNKLVTFKEELSSFIENSIPNKPLIFIVDELDRCRPDYAVEVLEKIKHFFSIKGIVLFYLLIKNSCAILYEDIMAATVSMRKSIYADLLTLNIYCRNPTLNHTANTCMNILISKNFLRATNGVEMD